jgi:hypothetical protein
LIPAEFVIYTDNAAFATELPTELHTHFAFKVLPFAKFTPELSGLEIKGEYVALIKPGFFVSEEILFDLGKRYLRQGSMYFALESELKAGTWDLAALDSPERLTTYLTAKWQRPYYLRAAFKKPSYHCRILQEEAFVIVPRPAWDQTKGCATWSDLDITTLDGNVYTLPPRAEGIVMEPKKARRL